MTNYEKIKNMSVEDMTVFFDNICDSILSDCSLCPAYNLCQTVDNQNNECIKNIKSWLESEADNDT